MQKLNSVKIIQISACTNDSRGLSCLGLGDDQNMYYWDYTRAAWFHNSFEADKTAIKQ